MPTAVESLVPERCYLLFAGRQSISGPIGYPIHSFKPNVIHVRWTLCTIILFFFTLIATFRAARGIPSSISKKKKWRWQLYWCNIRSETRFISIHLRTLIFGQEPGGKRQSYSIQISSDLASDRLTNFSDYSKSPDLWYAIWSKKFREDGRGCGSLKVTDLAPRSPSSRNATWRTDKLGYFYFDLPQMGKRARRLELSLSILFLGSW